MKTKKQLRIEHGKARNEIAHLESYIERLKADRSDLADQLSDPIKKANRDLYLALTTNLTKSLNQKNAVNMKPDEKDAVYYLMERLLQMLEIGKKAVRPTSMFIASNDVIEPCSSIIPFLEYPDGLS